MHCVPAVQCKVCTVLTVEQSIVDIEFIGRGVARRAVMTQSIGQLDRRGAGGQCELLMALPSS